MDRAKKYLRERNEARGQLELSKKALREIADGIRRNGSEKAPVELREIAHQVLIKMDGLG